MKPHTILQELEHLERAFRYVKNWNVAIDGGANAGDWTMRMSERFSQVLAFEPAEDTFKMLQDRVNNLQNVRIFKKALWSDDARVSVEEPSDKPGRTRARFVIPNLNGFPAVAIDELQLNDVGLIKLDLEGAESFALKGAIDTLTRCRPVVIIEEDLLPVKRYGVAASLSAWILRGLGMRCIERHHIDGIYIFD